MGGCCGQKRCLRRILRTDARGASPVVARREVVLRAFRLLPARLVPIHHSSHNLSESRESCGFSRRTRGNALQRKLRPLVPRRLRHVRGPPKFSTDDLSAASRVAPPSPSRLPTLWPLKHSKIRSERICSSSLPSRFEPTGSVHLYARYTRCSIRLRNRCDTR